MWIFFSFHFCFAVLLVAVGHPFCVGETVCVEVSVFRGRCVCLYAYVGVIQRVSSVVSEFCLNLCVLVYN